MSNMPQEPSNNRATLIGAITSPLGFFALALLIVEGFLTITVVWSNLEPGQKFWGMIIGAFLFVLVVIGVFVLVWHRPTNLTFSESGHLLHEQWGTSEKPAPTFEGVTEASAEHPTGELPTTP